LPRIAPAGDVMITRPALPRGFSRSRDLDHRHHPTDPDAIGSPRSFLRRRMSFRQRRVPGVDKRTVLPSMEKVNISYALASTWGAVAESDVSAVVAMAAA